MAVDREQHRRHALLVHARPWQHHGYEHRQLHGTSRSATHSCRVDGGGVLRSMVCALTFACAAAMTISAQVPGANALHVCHAGSLLAAFTQVEDEFKKQHPAVTITDTSGGSVDLVRRFAAGRLECDVLAPADHLVIDAMLKPARFAEFTVVFASGRMVLAYSAND